MTPLLPELFIGSSSEGQAVARAIEIHLQQATDTTIWMNGVFRPEVSFLQSLLNALDNFDFAVLVLTPDKLLSGSKKIRFAEAVACAEVCGLRLSRINGSHHISVHPGIPALVHLQNVNG